MPTAWSAAGDFDPRLLGISRCLEALLGQVRDTIHGMSGHRHGWRDGPWEKGSGRAKGPWEKSFGWSKGGPRDWAGGFGGPFGGWWPGPPGPPRGPKAGRGDVRAAILALLQEGPRNGYQIMSEIEERSGGAWRPSPGAVYPALQQLADEGLIVGEESGGRRTFRLTEDGRRYVAENPDQARAAWEGMAQDGPGEVPGLFVQAARLGGSIVQLAHAGTPEQVRAAEQLLEETRRKMYQILASDEPADPDDQ